MRISEVLMSVLIILTVSWGTASAFEKEAERIFPAQREPSRELVIVSSTDLDLMTPLVDAFRLVNQTTEVRYIQASSLQVFTAVEKGEPVDLAISSAMDLQTKLVNDGHARTFRTEATASLPDWVVWRDQLVGLTEEPAVMVYAASAFQQPPQGRVELIRRIRSDPARFHGRIATYDPRVSGLGYLFATQDAQQSDVFWRLAEVIGGRAPRLSGSSARMIRWADRGDILVAYNVLGSYAERQRKNGARIRIVEPTDYTLLMMRTALLPRTARNPKAAISFIDFLLSPTGRTLLDREAGLKPITTGATPRKSSRRPILLGPGLLVYLDQMKKQHFLRAWDNAISER